MALVCYYLAAILFSFVACNSESVVVNLNLSQNHVEIFNVREGETTLNKKISHPLTVFTFLPSKGISSIELCLNYSLSAKDILFLSVLDLSDLQFADNHTIIDEEKYPPESLWMITQLPKHLFIVKKPAYLFLKTDDLNKDFEMVVNGTTLEFEDNKEGIVNEPSLKLGMSFVALCFYSSQNMTPRHLADQILKHLITIVPHSTFQDKDLRIEENYSNVTGLLDKVQFLVTILDPEEPSEPLFSNNKLKTLLNSNSEFDAATNNCFLARPSNAYRWKIGFLMVLITTSVLLIIIWYFKHRDYWKSKVKKSDPIGYKYISKGLSNTGFEDDEIDTTYKPANHPTTSSDYHRPTLLVPDSRH